MNHNDRERALEELREPGSTLMVGTECPPHGLQFQPLNVARVAARASDGSRISGPMTGLFCGPGESARQVGTPSYGGPHGENDRIEFNNGSGRFEGLHGTALFSQREAGAQNKGTLTGTLSG